MSDLPCGHPEECASPKPMWTSVLPGLMTRTLPGLCRWCAEIAVLNARLALLERVAEETRRYRNLYHSYRPPENICECGTCVALAALDVQKEGKP